MVSPIGVPRETRVNRTLSSTDSMLDPPPGLEGSPVRELDLLAGDELEEDGLTVLVHLARPLEGGDDLGRFLHPLGVTAHGPAHVRVVPPDVARAVAVVRHHEGVT